MIFYNTLIHSFNTLFKTATNILARRGTTYSRGDLLMSVMLVAATQSSVRDECVPCLV